MKRLLAELTYNLSYPYFISCFCCMLVTHLILLADSYKHISFKAKRFLSLSVEFPQTNRYCSGLHRTRLRNKNLKLMSHFYSYDRSKPSMKSRVRVPLLALTSKSFLASSFHIFQVETFTLVLLKARGPLGPLITRVQI